MRFVLVFPISTVTFAVLACLVFAIPAAADDQAAIRRAVSYLSDEVPRWRRENGCFSCHNNGDAARALFQAKQHGFEVPAAALRQTTSWLAAPGMWHEDPGEEEFQDKRLATIQFAFALLTAIETKQGGSPEGLATAAKLIANEQELDGSWPIGVGGAFGAPATYGVILATCAARRVLDAADPDAYADSLQRATTWLQGQNPRSVFESAALLLALRDLGRPVTDSQVVNCLTLIRESESSAGGWGPYASRATEPFDTSVVLLALHAWKNQTDCRQLIARGRKFLLAEQLTGGGWRETTRPANLVSYAQHLSTTAWATLALLETRPVD